LTKHGDISESILHTFTSTILELTEITLTLQTQALVTGLPTPTIITRTELPISQNVVQEYAQVVESAVAARDIEDTLVEREQDLSTFLCRVDGTVTHDGQAIELIDPRRGQAFPPVDGTGHVFEVEWRPLFGGTLRRFSPQYRELVDAEAEHWPYYEVVVMEGRPSDDAAWIGEHRVVGPNQIPNDVPLLLRASHDDPRILPVQHRLIAPGASDALKFYAERMGLMQRVRRFQDLPRSGRWVLKPTRGCFSDGVVEADAGTPAGRRSLKRAFAHQSEGMYIQRWYPPLRYRGRNVILRIFFGLRRVNGQLKVTCLGGAYVISPHNIIHGTPDIIAGPAILVYGS
jgi:hypothetical protein